MLGVSTGFVIAVGIAAIAKGIVSDNPVISFIGAALIVCIIQVVIGYKRERV